MSKIAEFFINNPKLAVMLSFFMLLAGIMGLKNINAETNPAVDFATAIITTSYPGASSSDIETKITKPIEDEVKTVSDIKDVRSISQPGLSTLIVRVDMDKKGVHVPEIMSDLQKAVDRVSDFPTDLIDLPVFTEIKSEEFPVVVLAIIGSNNNRKRDIVADLLKEEIEDNKGVKSVSLDGYNERRFNIDLDPDKMLKFNIGINEVLQKIESRNISVPSGNLKSSTDQVLTRIEAKINNSQELMNIVIRSNFNGNSVTLKDIANIVDGEEEPKIIAQYNSKNTTLLTIMKKSNVDTLELVDAVNKKIDQFRDIYGQELSFEIAHDESNQVKLRLSILAGNATAGLIIILVFLFIFLPGKIGISTSFTLPLSVMATIGLMYAIGINLNTVTILALVIVLGMLLDDSVVVSESFVRYLHRGMEPRQAAVLSIKRLWLPISATSFTTIAAFLPMLVTKGIMGKFIGWIPIIVSLALLLSLIECFFLLPARLALGKFNIKKLKNNEEEDWFSKFEKKFERLICSLIKKRYYVLLSFFGIIAISVFMMFFANKFILFPSEQTEIYIARFKAERGSRLEHTSNVMSQISSKIKEKMGDRVKHILGNAGITDEDASQPKYSEGDDVGYLKIYVDEDTQYNMHYSEFLKQLRSIEFDGIKEITFETVVNGPPVGSDIDVTFRSNNFNDINQLIELVKNDLSKVNGIQDLGVGDVLGEDEVFINIDYEKADRLGLSISTVGNSIKTAIAGSVVSKVTLENKDIDLFVRFKESSRKSVADLEKIKIMDIRGNLVPLKNFASFSRKGGSPFIKRYDYRRSKTLFGNVNDNIITAKEANNYLKEILKKYSDNYPSVSVKYGGAEETTKESLDSLGSAFIIAIMAIFSLMVFLFKSYFRPFIIITSIPLGLFGFSLAFFFHNKPISFMSIIGIIGLAGVVVNSGIVLMSYIMRLLEEGRGKESLHKTLSYASSMRLRSVTITSITTLAGLAPTAYGLGGKDAILSPMTLSMMWGLASGTIMALIWIPCAYAILDDIENLLNRILKSDLCKGN